MRRWLLVCTALAMLLALGGWWTARWWTYRPWPALKAVMSTFPVPEGYGVTRTGVVGDRPAVCSIKPSCEQPAVWAEYNRKSGVLNSCSALKSAARKWELTGFDLQYSKTYSTVKSGSDPTCEVSGSMDGHGIEMLSFDDDQPLITVRITS